ncbi:HDOD domain-containing protein [Coralloluteibacterium thermophilus]|uniref:HDOD domain-containing protein n=1 Tax=Coralloluteibacterium thermophilum TaxID=2707049 RepID=A0ABV9NGW4_9GAMM
MTTPALVLAGLACLSAFGFLLWRVLRRPARPVGEAAPLPTSVRAPPPRSAAVEAPSSAVAGTASPDEDPGAADAEARIEAALHALRGLAFDDAPLPAPGEPLPPAHAEIARAAGALLARMDAQSGYIPRRPQLLPRLMQTVNNPDASLRSIAAIIAQDPALAGNLLRIANSSMYRVQSRPVESMERAVVTVGTEGIRQIIAAALVQPVMESAGSVFGRFPGVVWEHALLAAAVAAEHARRAGQEDPFAAQLLGLLHGLAAIVVVRVVRDQYAKRPELVPEPAVAAAVLDAWTVPTARRIAEHWSLSPRIAAALDEALAGPGAYGPLARAHHVGRATAALAILHRAGRLDEAEALRVLDGCGESGVRALWARATAPEEESVLPGAPA